MRAHQLIALVTLAVACNGDDGTAPGAPGGDFKLVFSVENHLLAPVTVAIDGVPYALISSGERTGLTVSSNTCCLSRRTADPIDNTGKVSHAYLGYVRNSVLGINRVLEITNVVNDQPYIAGIVLNTTRSPVSLGIYDGTSVSCAAALPAQTEASNGFILFGYYKLRPATEVRAYRDPTNCTGPYLAWPRSQVQNYEAKSGIVRLVLESAP